MMGMEPNEDRNPTAEEKAQGEKAAQAAAQLRAEREGMTPQEAAIAASAMFDPTIRRMTVLITTLIQVTENGDFALWAPLHALMAALRGLNWDTTNRENAVKFHALCAVSLTALGQLFEQYRVAIGALEVGIPLPPLPAWGDTEIVEMYDLVAARFGQGDGAK